MSYLLSVARITGFRLIIIITFLLLYVEVNAQINDTALYHVLHSTTGFINRTNDGHSYLLNNHFALGYTQKKTDLNLTGNWIYGRQDVRLTNNDFSAVFDINYLKGVRKLYYWALLTYDKSYSLKLNNRLQAGAGPGYTLVQDEHFHIVVSNGILYEMSELYDTTAYQTIRNSLRLKYRIGIFSNKIIFDGTNFLQHSFLMRKDYIIKALNNVSFKLNNWVSITASTTYNQLSLTRKENLLCNFGLRFERHF